MEKNQTVKNISVLSAELGQYVVKVTLEPNKALSETDRVILIVLKGGQVFKHPHTLAKQNTSPTEGNPSLVKGNPSSELYTFINNWIRMGVDKMPIPEVAGENSPTGLTEHAIGVANETQVILAIKKGQEPGLWQTFSQNPRKYLQNMGFGCSLVGCKLNMISRGSDEKDEFITLDLVTKQLEYLGECKDWRKNVTAKVNLRDLLQTKDAGKEM